jgi:hypothetical protein
MKQKREGAMKIELEKMLKLNQFADDDDIHQMEDEWDDSDETNYEEYTDDSGEFDERDNY